MSTFESLRIRNFRLLLAGTTLSYAAIWIQQVTLSWLIYDLTSSGTMLGSLNLIRSMASVGMIPIAGLLIDRVQRRGLLLFVNAWLFTFTFTFAVILLCGYSRISYIFFFSFMGGLAQTVNNNLRQVLVFDLVPRRFAPNALAIIQIGWSIMRSFGPGLGGLLILWFGPGGNFLIQSCAYVLIAITILYITFPERRMEPSRNSPLENIREGIRYVSKERETRTFMLMGFVFPLFIIPIFSILPAVYAADVFHGGADVLGYIMSSIGIGGIVGGFFTASLSKVERRGLLQLGALLLVSLTLMSFAFCTRLWIALLVMATAGFFEIIFLTTNQTLLQLSIPDDIRGRVTSIVNLNGVIMPMGGLMAGVGSDLFGGPKTITIIMSGTAACIAVLVYLFSTTIRNYQLSQAIGKSSKEPYTDALT